MIYPSSLSGVVSTQVPKPSRQANDFADWLERPKSLPRNGQARAAPAPEAQVENREVAAEAELPAVSDDSDLDVQLQCRTASGLELISLPWRLAASGHLSHWMPPQATGEEVFPPAFADAAAARIANAARASSAGQPTTSVPMQRSADAVFATCQVLPRIGDGDGDESASAGCRIGAHAALPWLARLVRWLEQNGRDPTVWIRDYRLDDAHAQQLSDALRAHAREQGIVLERIVVNGRQLWSATAHTRTEAR